MNSTWAKWPCRLGLAALTLTLFVLPHVPGWAQTTTFNEREVKAQASTLDKSDVWALDFRFKDPRMIKVAYPGRGTRIFWYMWYQVINRTGEPRLFVPDFELVTLDNPAVYHDEVLPFVEQAIRKIEDPTRYQDIQNSVTIGKNPIPVSKPASEAFPRAITGVAIWDATPADPEKRDPNARDLASTTRFSIFVRGLSNGFVTVDPLVPGGAPITRYKTLQMNFKRVGDRFSQDARDIQFQAPAEWMYRASQRKVHDKKEAPPKADPKADPKAEAPAK
jgi:hypothetical protein